MSDERDAQIARFEEECARLEDMLREFAQERRLTNYVPAIGFVLAAPTYWWRWWAAPLIFVCAIVMAGTWRYLLYGHVNERTFQLEKAREELGRLRAGGAVDAAEDVPLVRSEAERAFPAKVGVKPLSLFGK
jgi:hypothetical protein